VSERVYEHIRFGVDDVGVATITLHRPDVRNAFSGRMGAELSDAYTRCDTDNDIRAVVLTGTPPAFCAGADMTPGDATFARPAGADAGAFTASPVRPPAWEVRKPVIAAVNGHAVGIGLTLALQCDLRYIARDAKYGVVQARRGVIGDCMSHWTLPRVAGLANAADILLTGRLFDGGEAKELGVANRVFENADDVLSAAIETARDIAVNVAPLSAALSKRLLWDSIANSRTPHEVERLETALHHVVMGSEDAKEGVRSFVERRAPTWTLRVSEDWPEWPST
jgi:enoyl-CoA hydratase/carnithine racemase